MDASQISQSGPYGTPAIPLSYIPQLAPQGFFGNLVGGPVGGFPGSTFGGVLGNPTLGRQVGQTIGTVGGGFLPFSVDPVTAAYAQQAQLAPQGFFGDILGQFGRPLGGAIGTLVGNPVFGGQLGGVVGQLGQRFLPFSIDPVTAAYAQQAQLAPQGFWPLGGAIGTIFGNPVLGGQLGGVVGQLGQRFLPFSVDPITAAYAQQAQLAPQGFFGDILGQVGRPLGGAIGTIFGNPVFGGQLGGVVGQLGQRFLPFGVDPMTAAYAQQAQLTPQGFFGNPALGGQLGGVLGHLGQRFVPFQVTPGPVAAWGY
jgi:hypothetical protein